VDRSVPSLEILGVPVARLSRAEALDRIQELYEAPGSSSVAYVNAHSLNLAYMNAEYRNVLNRAALVLNDGSGMAMAARLKGGRFPENLNGSDVNPLIIERAALRGWPVYLLGAREGVAERAAAALRRRYPGLEMAGVHHGFFPEMSSDAIADRIRSSGAGLLMVAMGNPRQELWLADHLLATGASVGLGVGAFFDFSAGEVPRAPAWMNRAGIEWMYRLGREPRRLFRRYIVGNPTFLVRAWRDRKS
jgi:exopolysaccharide biosynthesis WecB/TagA/CpsF family protein